MECPACGQTMTPYHLADLEVDRCLACGLVWFDANELKRFLSLVDRPRPDEEAPAPENLPVRAACCPRCSGQPLERVHWRQFPLAFCGRCSGILLTDSVLAGLRVTWSRIAPRPLQVQLPVPEGWDSPAQQFIWAVFGAL
jgi:Zn-finger nucleic acid-binding protein